MQATDSGRTSLLTTEVVFLQGLRQWTLLNGPTPKRLEWKLCFDLVAIRQAASKPKVANSRVRFLIPSLIALMALIFVLGPMPAAAADVKSLAAAIDAHYNHLRSLQAEFTEVYRGSGMERSESGTLWLKKPGKMRWEYRSPKEKLFVSDGKDAWFYVPEDGQARKSSARKLDDARSPLAFLLGKTKLEKELRGLSLAPDKEAGQSGNIVLRGVPKGMEEQLSEILLEVTPENRIVRLVIQGVDGASTEYRFSDQKENVAIGDGKFGFKPPAGTEIMESGL